MKNLIFLCISGIVGRDLTISHLSGAVEDIKCVIFSTLFECSFHIFSTRFECSFSQGDIETIHEANVGQLHNILEGSQIRLILDLYEWSPWASVIFSELHSKRVGKMKNVPPVWTSLEGGFQRLPLVQVNYSFRV